MSNIGIIAEFNPFHDGHKYLIDKARTMLDIDNVTVVCSGNFVQRGLPAIFSKKARAKMALDCGVDLVLELPTVFSLADAGTFAKASVSTLDKCGVIDYLIFGAECNDINILDEIADVLYNEPNSFKCALKEFLSTGDSYPLARQKALESYFKRNINNVISGSNNILAIEYLIALKELNSSIKPVCIKRIGEGYQSLNMDSTYPSATAIRQSIENNEHIDLGYNYPENFLELNDFSLILGHLLTKNIDDYIKNNEFKNRIKNLSDSFIDFESFAKNIKAKNMTYTATLRNLFRLVLDIKYKDLDIISNNYNNYATILGFNKNSDILSQIKKRGVINLVSKISDFSKTCSSVDKLILDINLRADEIYRKVYMNKYKTVIPNEFRRQIVIKK